MGYIREDEVLLPEELYKIETERDEVRLQRLILFRDNLKLVTHVAKNFSNPRDGAIDRDDIMQAGYFGLWEACTRYDSSGGASFSTYAVPTISGHILRLLRDSGELKIPRIFKDIRSALTRHGFTIPLNDEEIDILVSEGKFSRYQIMQYSEPEIASLDFVITEEGDGILADIIPDPDADIEKALEDSNFEDTISGLLQYIKPQHRDMIEEWMYSVLIGDTPIGQKELATKYNISQPQVSRVLKSTIELLRNSHSEDIKNLFGIEGQL